MYRIEKNDQVFIASPINSLVIPENMETLSLFKDTLINLFKMKYFIIKKCALIKQELCRIEMQKITNIARNTTCTNDNNEFPFVFIPPLKKRKGSDANEDDADLVEEE